jgi:hypothetical protein
MGAKTCNSPALSSMGAAMMQTVIVEEIGQRIMDALIEFQL